MKLLCLVAVVGCLLVPPAQANKSSEDIRCKCICPPYRNISGHIYNQNVPQKDCNCLHVVEPMPVPGHDVEAYCLLCKCRYEERSTTTIKVIIVIYLSVVGALLLYMAFLMLVDPLIRKPDAYTEQLHNEEENEDARSMAAAAASIGGPRANTVLERVEGVQQRWKLQVQEQWKTQDAQLDGCHGSVRAPDLGYQLLGQSSLGLPFKCPWHLSFSLSLEMYSTVITREWEWVSGL